MRIDLRRSLVTGLLTAAMVASPGARSADAQVPAEAAPHHLPGVVEQGGGARRLTPEDLQRELFQFVDRYRELVGQVTDFPMGAAVLWFRKPLSASIPEGAGGG